ncbi:MAG: hypothetical protein EOP84_22670 [Verrucomicrobiaceae bacterium]|nr:MAG: hypothetical protein EOP84_22670 [Verrucomicrobiaceae bacterium]
MLLSDLSSCKGSVLSGSVVRWGDALEASFDLVIFLYVPHELRMARLLRREIELFGAPKPEFMQWAARYDTGDLNVRSRALHEMWLATLRCPVIRLEGDLTTDQQIESILSEPPRSIR